MKTRIKVETFGEKKYYTPQYKWLCFWRGFKDATWDGHAIAFKFERLEDAKRLIDTCSQCPEIVYNISYIDYP